MPKTRPSKPTARQDRKTNARQKGELKKKQDEIDDLAGENLSQAQTIASLVLSVASLETKLANTQDSLAATRDRTKALEDFQGRNEGFAPSKLTAGNFSAGIITNVMLDSGIDGAKLASRSVPRGRIVLEDLTNDEMATSTVGPRVLDLSYLDTRYARR